MIYLGVAFIFASSVNEALGAEAHHELQPFCSRVRDSYSALQQSGHHLSVWGTDTIVLWKYPIYQRLGCMAQSVMSSSYPFSQGLSGRITGGLICRFPILYHGYVGSRDGICALLPFPSCLICHVYHMSMKTLTQAVFK